MSAYHTRSAINAEVPAEFLLEALDDDRDGVEDDGVYDQLAASASAEVDAYLGGRFNVPFSAPAIPALAETASRVFCLESLYQRRGYTNKTDPPNPWAARAAELRARLSRIAAGEEPLRPDPAQGGAVQTITEPSRTTSQRGRMGY